MNMIRTEKSYTEKEYDVLLYLRKRPRTAKKLYAHFQPNIDQWNIWMSDLDGLYYVEPEGSKLLNQEGTLYLNEIGKTIAGQEKERRTSSRTTRKIAICSLVISIIAILLQAAGLILQWLSLLPPQ